MSSGRPKLGGAFTKATPFDGLRVLAPGEPNTPAPAPPLRSVPDSSEPDEATDQVAGDTAESAARVSAWHQCRGVGDQDMN